MSRVGIVELLNIDAAVRQWVRRQLGDIDHEQRVARHARTLFGITQPWHGLDADAGRLLQLAAMLHDVGRVWGERKHARRGAVMVLESGSLPLSPRQRRRLAFLTRYHRGKVPLAGTEKMLDRDVDDAFAMRVLLGILRVADALDSRCAGGMELAMVPREHPSRQVIIDVYWEGNAGAGICRQPKKFRLLEQTLHCQIRLTRRESLRMVG
jgi:exopolyphosphatase/pppGpp-phosphohydrolase